LKPLRPVHTCGQAEEDRSKTDGVDGHKDRDHGIDEQVVGYRHSVPSAVSNVPFFIFHALPKAGEYENRRQAKVDVEKPARGNAKIGARHQFPL